MKPSLFSNTNPIASSCGTSEHETIALNAMKMLANTNDTFRSFNWAAYVHHREKDEPTITEEQLATEKKYFDQISPYLASEKSASRFSPAWKKIYDENYTPLPPVILDIEQKVVVASSAENLNVIIKTMIEQGWQPMGSHQAVTTLTQNVFSGNAHVRTQFTLEYSQTMKKV